MCQRFSRKTRCLQTLHRIRAKIQTLNYQLIESVGDPPMVHTLRVNVELRKDYRMQVVMMGWMLRPANAGSRLRVCCAARWCWPMRLADVILFFQELVNYHPDKLLREKGLLTLAGWVTSHAVVPRQNLFLCCSSMCGRGVRHQSSCCSLLWVLKNMRLRKFYRALATRKR